MLDLSKGQTTLKNAADCHSNSHVNMGRPLLYSTPEEKKAANRAKSKRHYEQYISPFHPIETYC